VTPNTGVTAYGELEAAGVVRQRQGSGTFVAPQATRLTDRERRRVLEQRVDALLTEARHLDFSLEEVFKIIHRRHAVMERHGAERGAG
jgi:DNA-binding transcriptional regulator YhcF (GntR family)